MKDQKRARNRQYKGPNGKEKKQKCKYNYPNKRGECKYCCNMHDVDTCPQKAAICKICNRKD